MQSNGFEPLTSSTSRVLILGTLPSQLSLQQGQYYAQPRNAFWEIMGELFGASRALSYDERTRRLIERGVALWDVCASAHRPGSLDSSIRRAKANDFGVFFAQHPSITLVCFNGVKAASLFEQKSNASWPKIISRTLPSTSPANARMTFPDKLAEWSVVRTECQK